MPNPTPSIAPKLFKPFPRAVFVATAVGQYGALYRWNAKGTRQDPTSLASPRLFDCSGLVTWSYREAGGPDWRATHNTDGLLAACTPIATLAELLAGDLVFYGQGDDPEHVMIYLGAGCVIGASGGGRATTTIDAALAVGARVKAFPSVDYRPDRIALRRLPLFVQDASAGAR